jgi:hypothetical protein
VVVVVVEGVDLVAVLVVVGLVAVVVVGLIAVP